MMTCEHCMMSLLLSLTDEGRCFESEPSHLPVGVCIDNLTKVNWTSAAFTRQTVVHCGIINTHTHACAFAFKWVSDFLLHLNVPNCI